MCLIIVKGKGVEKPTTEIIKKAYTANDDLCGISYLKPHGKLLECYRGLTLNELIEINEDIEDSFNVMYHFRIATSGNVNVLNAHPFPLYQNKMKVHTRPKITLAHNGITKGIGNQKYSDTSILVQYIEDNHLDYDFLLTLLSSNGGGKFAVLDLELAGIMLYGEFTESKSGLLFSNMYWKTDYTADWSAWNAATHTWDYDIDDKTSISGLCDVCQQSADILTLDRGIYLCEACLTWEIDHYKHVKEKMEDDDCTSDRGIEVPND